VLQRIVAKLSKIYQQSVSREVKDGNDIDSELLEYYSDEMEINKFMNLANEFFNLSKSVLIQPIAYNGSPKLRIIPNNSFFVYSNNKIMPTEPTHIIICSGFYKSSPIYTIYSDTEVLVVNANKEIQYDYMQENDLDGINYYGVLPFVYINRSLSLLSPIPDTDVLRMTKILPVVLSDLNFAVMYQAFSIIYGIDLSDENLKLSPNAFWSFKSDGTPGKTPSVGVIKPEVDIQAVINLVKEQFIMWLETKGIRAGDVQTNSSNSAASGFSKIMDEMDTSEDRKSQIEYFNCAENSLWELIIEYMHPVWVKNGLIEVNQLFTPGSYIIAKFNDPKPFISRGTMVTDLKTEVDAGFLPKKKAIQELNPNMSEKEIDEMIAEINGEKTITIDTELQQNMNMANDVNQNSNSKN
jgi:hypothetical protein